MTDEPGAGDRAASGRLGEPADGSAPANTATPGGAGRVIGLGVDLCEVDRMRTVLGRTPGFADRTFTAAEQQYCRRARDPAERFAARFAAKEAVLKALGAGLGACSFTDIEVARGLDFQPGTIVVEDRGYTDYALYARWTDNGVYFVSSEPADHKLNRQAKDDALARQLWERSEELVGLTGTQGL